MSWLELSFFISSRRRFNPGELSELSDELGDSVKCNSRSIGSRVAKLNKPLAIQPKPIAAFVPSVSIGRASSLQASKCMLGGELQT